MKKVRLGKTNLLVTKLGWGGIPIQRVGEEEAIAVIRSVVEMGVDLLDTARGYTNSEHRIGLALQKVSRPVVLSTKSPERTNKIYEEVRESLRQLKVQRIHIYHMHYVRTLEEYRQVMAPGGAYEGLRRARDEGLIDHIGMTSHDLRMLERAIEDGCVEVIMAAYSFLETEALQRVFPMALARDIGVLAMKPFSGGTLEDAGPALRFVLSTPGIVPIPGSETLERAKENWRIFAEGRPLTEKDQRTIELIRKEFEHQFCRRCDYCQPCSEGINIQSVMGLKGVVKRLGPKVQEVGWLKDAMQKSRNCSGCGECLPRCPYRLPIPDLIKENLAWYDDLQDK
jgi:predicted aldo/keto reductase-like oxidoreductase